MRLKHFASFALACALLCAASGARAQSTVPYTFANQSGSVTASELDQDFAAALLKGNNLSELSSPATARTNLGLGSLALQNAITDSQVSAALGFNPAPLISPQLGGVPTAPTASLGDASTQIANDAFVQSVVTSAQRNTLYVCAAAGNGCSGSGSDSNAGSTLASPLATLQQALILAAGTTAHIKLNGNFAPAAGSDYLVSSPVTIEAMAPGSATFTPAVGQSKLFEFANANGGSASLSGVVLNTSSTAAAAVHFDPVSGTQGVNLTNVTFIGGSGANYDNDPNASFTVATTGGSQIGSGAGVYMTGAAQGSATFTNFASSMMPSAEPTSAGSNVVSDFLVDANGTGATPGGFTVALNNVASNSTFPTLSSGTLAYTGLLENVNATVTGGTYSFNSQPGDTNANLRGLTIATDTVNPLPTTVATCENVTFIQNGHGSGHDGCTIGFDGEPNVSAITASQSGTTLTVTVNGAPVTWPVTTVSGTGGSLNPGVEIYGGPNWSGTPEAIVTQLTGSPGCLTGPCTFQMNVSQTLSSGTLYVLAKDMISGGLIQGNHGSYGPNALSGAGPFEGLAFCGFETGVQILGNYVGPWTATSTASYGMNVKGCTNTEIASNVIYDQGKEWYFGKGNVGTRFEHNTLEDQAFTAATIMFEEAQSADMPNEGYPYSTGLTGSGNIFDVEAPGNLTRYIGNYNSCATACLTTAGGANTGTLSGNLYYNIVGTIASGFPWVWDTSSGTSYSQIATNVFATWQSSKEASAVNFAPGLTLLAPLNASQSNLNILPVSSSAAISGSTAISSASILDYYGRPYATSPSYGAGQYQGGPTPTQLYGGKTPLFGSVGVAGSAGTTYYAPCSGVLSAVTSAYSGASGGSFPNSGTLSNLNVSFVQSPGTGYTSTATVDLNGADTALTCSATGASSGCSDITHSVAVALGNTCAIKYSTTTGGTPGKLNAGMLDVQQ